MILLRQNLFPMWLVPTSGKSLYPGTDRPDGSVRSVTWRQSNLFVNGTRTAPENVTVVGGKTGTTDEAGACLVLYEQDSQSRPYISVVMGAESKNALYTTMDSLLSTIPGLSQ